MSEPAPKAAGLLLVLSFALACTGNSDRPPNVVFILADDVGWRDTTPYGSRFHPTPNISRLSEQGVRFTNAYAASPFCSPTRSSIMTGLHPARTGITAPGAHVKQPVLKKSLRRAPRTEPVRTAQTVNRLDPAYETLAERFRDAGYATAHFGKWHLGYGRPYEPEDHGFDFAWPHVPRDAAPPGGYFAPWNTISDPTLVGEAGEHMDLRIAEEIDRFISENRDTPFFINFWPFSVHAPWHARPEDLERHRKRMVLEDPQHNPVYAAMMESLDEAVGRVVASLEAAGLSEETILVFSSDNGGVASAPRVLFYPKEFESLAITSNAPLRAGKASLYEGGTRVPLIFVWPGKLAKGGVAQALVSSTDLHPTLLDMAGIPVPKRSALDGVSQLDTLLRGASPRRSIFWHLPHGGPRGERDHEGYWPSSAIRRDNWKLIRRYAANADGSNQQFLYDLEADVGETHDLAQTRPTILKELSEQLAQALQEAEAVIPVRNSRYRQRGARGPEGLQPDRER